MSQEKLAALTHLNKRTIQRAESGQPVSIESLSFIAEALGVELGNIRGRQLELFDAHDARIPTESGEVVLVPASSGKRLVEVLQGAYETTLEVDLEPRRDLLEVTKLTVALVKRVSKNPWKHPDDQWFSDEVLLELQVQVNELLDELTKAGLRLFVGQYPRRVQVPEYDDFAGKMISRPDAPYRRRQKALVVISTAAANHLKRAPFDHADAEIPF